MNDVTISLRSKEEDVDYRFMVDPDLPRIKISPARIEKQRNQLGSLPFDRKMWMLEKYNLSVLDVQTIFN